MSRRSPAPYAPSILVVDDDLQIRAQCRRILEDTGYFAAEAGNGAEALNSIGDRFFEEIVADLSMPDLDGFELLKVARAQFPGVKVIVMSGFMNEALLSAARRLGAAAIIDKPFSPERLLAVLWEVLAAA